MCVVSIFICKKHKNIESHQSLRNGAVLRVCSVSIDGRHTWGVPFVRIGCVLHLRETAILDNGWINVMCACIRMLAGYQEDDTQDIKENVYVYITCLLIFVRTYV